MKKILLILLFTGIKSTIGQSFSKGVKAGINISNFTEDLFPSSRESLAGFHAGGFVNFKFGNISLQPELLISTAGARITEGLEKPENFNITYIAMPVMLKISPSKSGFYMEAGPQAGIKISEKLGSFKSFDFSLGLGLGYQSKIGLGAGFRYLAGLSKVITYDGNTSPDSKNRVMQAGIFYVFRKK